MPDMHHLVRIADLSRSEIDDLLARAEELSASRGSARTLQGRVVSLLFFQPSTRTRVGFQAAAGLLGATPIEITRSKYQPGMEIPESLEDTVRVVSDYSDILVIRSAEMDDIHAAAHHSSVPVINAGAGREHHPTQALLDLFTIKRHFGTVAGLRVGVVGDLAGSRAAHSLVDALSMYPPAELRLMAPSGRELPPACYSWSSPNVVTTRDEIDARDLDVLYMAGLPTGVGANALPETLRRRFQANVRSVDILPLHGLILCPLPRVDEITPEVDGAHQAGYFEQSATGLFVRMAVLERLTLPQEARSFH
jgi:aspartate carbamoyltransferase catalytic subunit